MEVAANGCDARDMLPKRSRESAIVGGPAVVEAGTVPRIGASVVFGVVDCLGVPMKILGTDCVGGDLAPGMLVNPLDRPGIAPVRSGGSAGVGIGLICGGSPFGG